MPQYQIQAVSQETRQYDTKFGQMTSYKIKLVGEDTPVELSQKSSTPAPQMGATLNGNIEQSQYGPKFKKEQQQGFGFGSPSASQHNTVGKAPFTMYLSYAKDIAVVMASNGLLVDKSGNINDALFGEILEMVNIGGKTLYDGRPGAESKDAKQPDNLPADDWDSNKPIDMSTVDAIFGPKPPAASDEIPFI